MLKMKKKASKNTMPKKKTRVSSENLTNQQPMIWFWDKKNSKGWPSKKTKVWWKKCQKKKTRVNPC